ncbi:MAG: ribonuclease P protein component [Lachnospiraceae bacterium]
MKFTISLKSNRDFQQIYRQGTSYANRFLVMYIVRNQSDNNKLGISVSKKVGNSVVRHRTKRLIKESYRLNEADFVTGCDIVIIARASAADAAYKEIESALLNLFKRHKLLNNL